MVYTLLGAATLGFDLVRIPGGRRVAELLLVALNLTEADLARLAAAHPGPGRQLRWRETVAAAGASASVLNRDLRVGADAVDQTTSAPIDLSADSQGAGQQTRARVLLRQLERSRLGDLDAVDRLIRTDILDWTWSTATGDAENGPVLATQSSCASRAADVLVDAVAAAYAVEVLAAQVRHQLELPLQASLATLEPAAPSGLPPATVRVLDQLRSIDASQRISLRAAVDHRHRSSRWAPAMHDASWAIHLSGRTRVAAQAQLHATIAFGDAGLDARDGAQGVWNAVAGVVADSVVRDMIADDVREVLTAPWAVVTDAAAAD